MARPIALAAIVLVVAGAAFFGMTFNMTLEAQSPMQKPFDAAVWADEEAIYETPHPRLAMVEDVIAHHLGVGQSREEVIALLGPPTDTPYFADRGMVYWLGDEQKSISVDSAWLVIDFDDKGAVSAFEVVTD